MSLEEGVWPCGKEVCICEGRCVIVVGGPVLDREGMSLQCPCRRGQVLLGVCLSLCERDVIVEGVSLERVCILL